MRYSVSGGVLSLGRTIPAVCYTDPLMVGSYRSGGGNDSRTGVGGSYQG